MRFTKVENILTEKGKVSASVRNSLMTMLEKDAVAMFSKAKCVGKGKYEIAVDNSTGTQTVYMRFEVSVSERSITSLAEKKPKAKVKAEENVEIE